MIPMAEGVPDKVETIFLGVRWQLAASCKTMAVTDPYRGSFIAAVAPR